MKSLAPQSKDYGKKERVPCIGLEGRDRDNLPAGCTLAQPVRGNETLASSISERGAKELGERGALRIGTSTVTRRIVYAEEWEDGWEERRSTGIVPIPSTGVCDLSGPSCVCP